MKRVVSILVGLGVTSTILRARADELPLREPHRAALKAGLSATSAPHTRAVSVSQLSTELLLAVRAARSVALWTDAAVASTSYRFGPAGRGGVTRMSNVLVGARWLTPPETAARSPSIQLDFGGSAGAPLVTVPSGGITPSAAAEQADRAAFAAAGPRAAWSWARSAVPVVAHAGLTVGMGRIRVRFELEPGLLLSVNRNPSRAMLVASSELAYSWSITPYASASTVVSTEALDRNDFAQAGVAAGARYDAGGCFGWSEWRLLLDGPDGITSRYGTFWGATLGGGVRF